MTDKEKIKSIIELFIAWNGETEVIDIANLDSAVDFIIDSMQEEPVSEELEKAAVEWFNSVKYKSDLSGTPIEGFKAGAQWHKQKINYQSLNINRYIKRKEKRNNEYTRRLR